MRNFALVCTLITALTGCANMTPEQKQAFSQALSDGLKGFGDLAAQQQQIRAQNLQALPPMPTTTNCTTRPVGNGNYQTNCW